MPLAACWALALLLMLFTLAGAGGKHDAQLTARSWVHRVLRVLSALAAWFRVWVFPPLQGHPPSSSLPGFMLTGLQEC